MLDVSRRHPPGNQFFKSHRISSLDEFRFLFRDRLRRSLGVLRFKRLIRFRRGLRFRRLLIFRRGLRFSLRRRLRLKFRNIGGNIEIIQVES